METSFELVASWGGSFTAASPAAGVPSSLAIATGKASAGAAAAGSLATGFMISLAATGGCCSVGGCDMMSVCRAFLLRPESFGEGNSGFAEAVACRLLACGPRSQVAELIAVAKDNPIAAAMGAAVSVCGQLS